ncbi:MAG: hypothetical protein KZQ81_18885 [Candidatus Thiodiazotropha sp. (ex Rostrolucina anterorostrata)]|nr:hypothetical protein [Candidatus Thiodiazotropha sp. (ex Rostrolucina anterorostrata)]
MASTTQVILATQSARLVDEFEPDQVLVFEVYDGETKGNRLEQDKLAR